MNYDEILSALGIDPWHVRKITFLKNNRIKVYWKDGVSQIFIIQNYGNQNQHSGSGSAS